MDDDTDKQEFGMMASHIRTIAMEMLEQHFGERCLEFEPDCECCKRWKALDDLVANPYAD